MAEQQRSDHMSIFQAEVPQTMETLRDDDGADEVQLHHHHHATPPPPPGVKVDLRMNLELYHTVNNNGIHPHDHRGKNMQPGYIAQQQNHATLWKGSQSSKALLSTGRDAGVHRRPRPSNAFDLPIQARPWPIGPTTTDSTSTTTRTSDDDTGSGTGESANSRNSSNRDLWKVKVAGGEFLESTSYNSLHDDAVDAVHENATRVLRRLKLNKQDEDDDKASSTATTKVSNFTFQKSIQRTKCSLTATAYYRPDDGFNPALSPLPPTIKSSKSAASSRNRSKEETTNIREIYSEPSGTSVTIDTLPSGLSSLSYNSSQDGNTPESSSTPQLNKITKRSPNRSQRRNIDHMRQQVAIVESASESDDDSEMKRMEDVTHTFQRNDSTSKNSKFSAAPLSGIGVDVSRNNEDQYRIRTPREAMDASCSIASVMNQFFGVTPPREDVTTSRISPFNMVKNILCSPDRGRNYGSTKKSAKNEGSEYADDWSVGADTRTEYSQSAFGDDETSCMRSESRARFSSSYIVDNRSECSSRNGKTDYRRSSFVPNRNDGNRNQAKSSDSKARQDRYDKNISYRHYHREDMSYQGTDADTSCYEPSNYSCAGDDQSEAVSRLTEVFQDRRYRNRDSPFVRRLKTKRYDDEYGDDDTSYS